MTFILLSKTGIHIARAIALILLTGLLACVTTTGTYSSRSHDRRNYIFVDEIQSSAANNAYDLVRNLRPHWLRGRGPKSIRYEMASYPVIYVDGSRYGNINSLKRLPVDNIVEIQYMNAGDATIRFGVNHPSGAILITMFY